MQHNRPTFPRLACRLALLFAALLLAPAAARADAVRLSGLWVSDVTIRGVQDGRLTYVTRAGAPVEVAVDKVEGVRITRQPEYEEAVAAAEAGDHARAVRLLGDVRRQARQEWIEQLAAKRLVEELAAVNRAADAVETYVQLVQRATDPWFVPAAPVDAVRGASAEQKKRVRSLVTPAAERATAETQAALRQLLAAAADDATASPAQAAEGPATESIEVESAILLPASIPQNALVDLLRAGEFRQALDDADAALQSPGEMSLKLYLRGMAQLGLADASGEADSYKDAGLSFMRVIVYFPRSTWAGYARVEAGYVHAKIGRPDQARKLYDQARLGIDEAEEPAYYQRLLELTSQL